MSAPTPSEGAAWRQALAVGIELDGEDLATVTAELARLMRPFGRVPCDLDPEES